MPYTLEPFQLRVFTMSKTSFIAASLALAFGSAGAQTVMLGYGAYPAMVPAADTATQNLAMVRHPAPLTVRTGHANFQHPALAAREDGTSTANTATPFIHGATQVTVRGVESRPAAATTSVGSLAAMPMSIR
jgi:hypothetical protein